MLRDPEKRNAKGRIYELIKQSLRFDTIPVFAASFVFVDSVLAVILRKNMPRVAKRTQLSYFIAAFIAGLSSMTLIFRAEDKYGKSKYSGNTVDYMSLAMTGAADVTLRRLNSKGYFNKTVPKIVRSQFDVIVFATSCFAIMCLDVPSQLSP